MNQEDVRRYFDQRLDVYGPTVRAVDWGSAESQRLRFRVLTEVGDLARKSVLDVGAGLGDLCGFLADAVPGVRYEGCDVNPRMVAAAVARYPGGRFRVADLLDETSPVSGPYDYVLASGLFYLRDEEFLRATVARMFRLCTRGISFNSLSAWAERREPGEYHADPLGVLAFCRTLSSRVTLRHDYLPHDFTVYVYRHA